MILNVVRQLSLKKSLASVFCDLRLSLVSSIQSGTAAPRSAWLLSARTASSAPEPHRVWRRPSRLRYAVAAVELRQGKIARCLPQDFIGLSEFTVLPLQRVNPVAVVRCRSGSLAPPSGLIVSSRRSPRGRRQRGSCERSNHRGRRCDESP